MRPCPTVPFRPPTHVNFSGISPDQISPRFTTEIRNSRALNHTHADVHRVAGVLSSRKGQTCNLIKSGKRLSCLDLLVVYEIT